MASLASAGAAGSAISRRAFLRGALATALVGGYPFAIERYLVSVNHYEVPIAGLPGEFEGFRIVHLTDLHYGSLVPLAWVSGVLDQALREDGDLIVLTGDYVHARDTPEDLEAVWPELLRLDARDGVGMVLGNHDHWADSALALSLLSESGRSLGNRSRVIRRGGAGLAIAGVGDFWEDEVSIDAALAGVDPSLPCAYQSVLPRRGVILQPAGSGGGPSFTRRPPLRIRSLVSRPPGPRPFLPPFRLHPLSPPGAADPFAAFPQYFPSGI